MNAQQKIFLNNIDLKYGKVVYNAFEIIKNIPFAQQLFSFQEDLLQIRFGEECLIDVGWYPEFDENGTFLVQAIKNFDCENPIFQKQIKSYSLLKIWLQIIINCVDTHKNGNATIVINNSNLLKDFAEELDPKDSQEIIALLIHEIQHIFEDIKQCDNLEEAKDCIAELDIIQSIFAILWYKYEIKLPDNLEIFTKDFDRIDDINQQNFLFNQIKEDKYSL
jgi:hypothetical protein